MRIATLNVRNTADRWRERRSLLVRQLVDLAPDVIGLQELRVRPDQARAIARDAAAVSGGRLAYRCYRRDKLGLWGLWEGIAVLTRVPVAAIAWLDLGADARVAQRVTLRVADGGLLDLYNAHLAARGEERRLAQARRILEWMDTRRDVPAVLVGDLNARPGSPTVVLLSGRLRSAHLAVHGQEPARTVPSPLRARWSGEGSVLDYVFVNDLVEVVDARVAFDEVDPDDASLAASDHFGLAANVEVRGSVSGYCSPASPDPPPRGAG